jgi:tRNA uridine 5-carbamoylmethylation protein Kti12
MTLVIIFGPPAVGKMTVGLELERLTAFRLFHNRRSGENRGAFPASGSKRVRHDRSQAIHH